VKVVEIVGAVLQEHADGLSFSLADPRRIDIAAANVREAADLREHFTEGIGPLPSDGEGANRAATHAADGAQLGIVGEFHAKLLRHERQELTDEESRVGVAERVVFEAAVVRSGGGRIRRGAVSRVDENANGHRHLTFRDQVVEDNGHALATGLAHIAAAVLKNH
jgi:hypothetical protein